MSLKKLQMTRNETWEEPLLCRFVGCYPRGNEPCSHWYVDLEDHSGRVSLEVMDQAHPPTGLRLNTLVEVAFSPIFDDRPMGLLVESITPSQDRTPSQIVSTMPRPASPLARQALETLQTVADGLNNDPLGGFLARVLRDPTIGPGFLTVPASLNHHHAYPGGLLVHTVEVMSIAAELARMKLPQQPRRVGQCQMGALVHDLGKVLTHGKSRARPGPTLSHEFLSIRLVSPHIDWLSSVDPESADELSATLQHGTRPPANRTRSQSMVAELVALADQCSAMHLGDANRSPLYADPAANDTVFGDPGRRQP